jgi:hypothetical protein
MPYMRMFIASLALAVGVVACGPNGGGAPPAGGAPSAAPQASTPAQPANATKAPSPSKGDMGDDPYGYGY